MTEPVQTEATSSIVDHARKVLASTFEELSEGKRLLLSLKALGHEPPEENVQPALRVVEKCITWLDGLRKLEK